MTGIELARVDSKEVRKNDKLMRLYIQLYEDAFLVKPNCAGCTFNTDFRKFKKHYASNVSHIQNKKEQLLKLKKMDFKLKQKFNSTILTYRINNRPFRTYGKTMSLEFALSFLNEGTKEELEERKKMFDKLPTLKTSTKKIKVEDADVVKVDLQSESRKSLNEIADKLGLNSKSYKTKAQIIDAIERV